VESLQPKPSTLSDHLPILCDVRIPGEA